MNEQNTNTTVANTTLQENAAKETAAPAVSVEARVRPITPKNNLIGFASIKIAGCFAVNDIPVKSGKNGIYFDNPSKKDNKGTYRDVCMPVTGDFRKQITAAIAVSYEKAVEKMQAVGQAHSEQRPSIKEQLKEGAKAVAEQPAKPPMDGQKREAVAI